MRSAVAKYPTEQEQLMVCQLFKGPKWRESSHLAEVLRDRGVISAEGQVEAGIEIFVADPAEKPC